MRAKTYSCFVMNVLAQDHMAKSAKQNLMNYPVLQNFYMQFCLSLMILIAQLFDAGLCKNVNFCKT